MNLFGTFSCVPILNFVSRKSQRPCLQQETALEVHPLHVRPSLSYDNALAADQERDRHSHF